MLPRILWLAGSLLFLSPTGLCPQGVMTIEYSDVQVVTSLSGVVRDPGNAPMAGVLVEEFRSDWKTSLRSTKTDQSGHFAMTPVKDRKVYFLQFSFRNCNPLRIRISVDSEHGKELQVQMVNSS